MSARLEVVLDIQALDLQQQTLQTAPEMLDRLVASAVIPASQARADQTINVEAPPHIRPTDWTSKLQARWWFGVGRFQWSGRTGSILAWKVVVEQLSLGSGEIRAENPVPESRFVFLPPFKQRMHSVWMNADTWAEDESVNVAQDVADRWFEANGVEAP